MDSTDLSDAAANLLLNRAYWEIADKFPFRAKEVTSNTATVDGTRRYAMPAPFEALRFISIETDDGVHIKLNRITRVYYETKYVNDPDAEGQPTDYFREEDDYILYPTPDKVYTVVVGFWSIFDDLSASNITPEMPQVWHEIILLGAIARGWWKLGDYAKAREMRANQLVLINSTAPIEAKEEFDSRMAGIDIPEEMFNI